MTEQHWWDTHDNIVTLADWMADNDWSAHDVAGMVEKPWKYTDEWLEANRTAPT
jgi:hypothetical protein